MKPSISLGRIAGVKIGIHYSLLLVLALVTWSLAEGFLPDQYRGWATRTYWATGLLSAIMLFVSVLIHELAHSVVAKARGFHVEGITLFLLGGVSNLKIDANKARDEFVIASVGPLTSFGLSAIFWVALQVLSNRDAPVAAVIWYLAVINLLLGAFNLLPAFPLDGGRVLRSIVWAATGSLPRATRIAAFGGRMFGIVLMGLGALQALLFGNILGGIWIAFVGWFLHKNASGSARETALQSSVKGVLVKDVMDTDPVTVGPDVALSEVVFDYFLRRGVRSLPVCDGESLLGIISVTDIRSVPRERWESLRVRDNMTPLPLKHVGPEDDLLKAMALLGENSIHQAPVLVGTRLVGLLSRAHIIAYMHSVEELGIK